MADNNNGFSWWNAIPVVGGLFGSLFGANEQANATKEAAQITADAEQKIAAENAAAQEYVANLTSAANTNALNFSKAGAENAFQNNEVARAGNYDQWSAAQRRIGSVAKLLGFGDREIPAYRPGVDPNFTGSPSASGASFTGAFSPTAGANPTDPAAIQAALTKFYSSVGKTPTGRGSGPTDIAYYADQIANTGGLTPQNIGYWFGPSGRIANDLAGAGTLPTVSTPARTPVNVASLLGSTPTLPTTSPMALSAYLG